jgi:hypothetical protein
MYAENLTTPSRANDASGVAYAGAKWHFYASGTTTPAPVYTAADLTTAHADPVLADAGGLFPPVFFDPALSYRGVCTDATGAVTLHDIDPINAGLWTELGLANGAEQIGFTLAAGSTVTRTVADKLRDEPVDVADFGPIGTADDTAVFQAAYDFAKAAGRRLRLPSGTFYVSGLVFEGTIAVSGAGNANTIFRPTGDGQTVITVRDRDPVGWVHRGLKAYVADFGIELYGWSNCTGLKTEILVRSVLERICIKDNDEGAYDRNNIGWHSQGDQYSAFRDMYVEGTKRGFLMTNETYGGGVSNHFDGLHVAECLVNAMMLKMASYPMGHNQFTNFRLQASRHCSLYVNGVNATTMTMLPPDLDTSSAETIVIDGFTIQRGTVHTVNGAIRFDGYIHSNGNPDMRITAEDRSALFFRNCNGAAINTYADASSTIDYEGIWGNRGRFRNTRISLQAVNRPGSIFAYHPAEVVYAPGFPNECSDSYAVPVAAYFNCSSALCSDPSVGVAREVAFLAQAGTLNSNAIVCTIADTNFQPNDAQYCSILLRSDRDTTIGFIFAQSQVGGTVDLRAGEWTRLFMSNFNSSGLPRNRHLTFYPVAADQPVLRIAQPIGCRNLNALQLRQLTERHTYNTLDPMGAVLRRTAPPTTGTWAAGTEIRNSAPSAGAVPGWICVTSGTPGVWKAQAALAV